VSTRMEDYLKGWRERDIDMIVDACADDYVYDDPCRGHMTAVQLADYLRGYPEAEMEFGDEVLQEKDGEETFWSSWAWRRPGETEWLEEGASVVRADADGVHSEKITYYTRAQAA